MEEALIVQCPKCGGRNLRFSRLQTPKERLQCLVGTRPIRCRDCRTRFNSRTWRFSDASYARCPKCLRMDLSVWAMHHYRVSAFKSLLIYLGANTYRCEYCRHNFISLRRRKYKFSLRGRNQSKGLEGAAPETADVNRSDGT